MKISVIMPCYNCKEELERAVLSVLSCRAVDIELIIIDDFSTDGSRELLMRLKGTDSRIVAVFNEKNLGVSAVRNIGLDYARGDYIAFCDSDDTVEEGAYENMLKKIGNNDIVIGGFKTVSDTGREECFFVSKKDRKSPFKSVFSGSSLWHKLFRRDFIEKNGIRFNESLALGEDVVFLSELLTHRPSYAVTHKIVYNYYSRTAREASSLTHIYNLKRFREHIACRQMMLEILQPYYPECREYVYNHFVDYLDRFLQFIPVNEREEAFLEFRRFMSGYDYENHPNTFLSITGVPYGLFCSLSAYTYLQAKYDVRARDRVLYEFSSGRIGLRYAIRYIFAWLGYKIFGDRLAPMRNKRRKKTRKC